MKKLLVFVLAVVILCSFSSVYAGPWDYHHPRGYHYYGGHWWLGDTIVAGLVAGTIIATLPPHYRTVYVGGVPYYYDGTYYYQSGPTGYVVVQPAPGSVVEASAPYVRPAPPAPKVEVITVAPYPGAVWVPGHWQWRRRAREYVWILGHWRRY